MPWRSLDADAHDAGGVEGSSADPAPSGAGGYTGAPPGFGDHVVTVRTLNKSSGLVDGMGQVNISDDALQALRRHTFEKHGSLRGHLQSEATQAILAHVQGGLE